MKDIWNVICLTVVISISTVLILDELGLYKNNSLEEGKIKMTTTAAAPARDMETINAPELYSFTNKGEQVSGTLLRIDVVEVKGKKVTQYTIRVEGTTDRKQILGTWDLTRKLERKHIGRFVVITYLGENKEIKKGDNYLKEFKVEVEKASPNANAHGTEITDEDIPF